MVDSANSQTRLLGYLASWFYCPWSHFLQSLSVVIFTTWQHNQDNPFSLLILLWILQNSSTPSGKTIIPFSWHKGSPRPWAFLWWTLSCSNAELEGTVSSASRLCMSYSTCRKQSIPVYLFLRLRPNAISSTGSNQAWESYNSFAGSATAFSTFLKFPTTHVILSRQLHSMLLFCLCHWKDSNKTPPASPSPVCSECNSSTEALDVKWGGHEEESLEGHLTSFHLPSWSCLLVLLPHVICSPHCPQDFAAKSHVSLDFILTRILLPKKFLCKRKVTINTVFFSLCMLVPSQRVKFLEETAGDLCLSQSVVSGI